MNWFNKKEIEILEENIDNLKREVKNLKMHIEALDKMLLVKNIYSPFEIIKQPGFPNIINKNFTLIYDYLNVEEITTPQQTKLVKKGKKDITKTIKEMV